MQTQPNALAYTNEQLNCYTCKISFKVDLLFIKIKNNEYICKLNL